MNTPQLTPTQTKLRQCPCGHGMPEQQGTPGWHWFECFNCGNRTLTGRSRVMRRQWNKSARWNPLVD